MRAMSCHLYVTSASHAIKSTSCYSARFTDSTHYISLAIPELELCRCIHSFYSANFCCFVLYFLKFLSIIGYLSDLDCSVENILTRLLGDHHQLGYAPSNRYSFAEYSH